MDAIQKKNLLVDPHPPQQHFQPASIDLRLGDSVYNKGTDELREDCEYITFLPYFESANRQNYYLAHTEETVGLPADARGFVAGKSSFGRLFVTVHQTAGFIDPGFQGQITLEVINFSNEPVTVKVGDPICQLEVALLSSPAMFPYGPERGSHYQGQTGPTESRL